MPTDWFSIFTRKATKVYQHRNNVPVLNVINLTDSRADPKRFIDISASNVSCIDA
jgi:hypothetical protein